MTPATDHDASGVLEIVDALEDAVQTARAMPMSASVLVNRAELLDLVAQLRAAVPQEIVRADEVLLDADQRISEAEERAERVIAAARARAEQLVAQEQVTVQAQVRAHEIVTAAQEAAATLRDEADDYCDRRLAEFEIDLGKITAQVQAGRAKLARRLASQDDDGA